MQLYFYDVPIFVPFNHWEIDDFRPCMQAWMVH